MQRYVNCPWCKCTHKLTPQDIEKINAVGKSAIDCPGCLFLYTVKDDGDGIYTIIRNNRGEPVTCTQ